MTASNWQPKPPETGRVRYAVRYWGAAALAAALAVAACGSGPPYPDERAICGSLQALVDARAAGDQAAAAAALDDIGERSRRTQNINLALFGQGLTGQTSRRIPNAFDRLVNECLRVGLTIAGVKVPPGTTRR